ncbi:hypothetical protein [Streptomyces carpinensis]|uniref:Uncharacterized protein n=1 Tax=Streptomyces carpinensis TaxID=66369 RepID=A0ABV1W492_9ACTN
MPKPNPAPKLREAAAARDALAAALTRAGIQLPAMDVRTPWADPLHGQAEAPASTRYALVHLGVCSAPVALALADVIARGAEHGRPLTPAELLRARLAEANERSRTGASLQTPSAPLGGGT